MSDDCVGSQDPQARFDYEEVAVEAGRLKIVHYWSKYFAKDI